MKGRWLLILVLLGRHVARPRFLTLAVFAVIGASLALSPGGVTAAATITVDSTADTNTSDTVLTLREAILVATGSLGRALSAGEADNVAGTAGSLQADTITFDAGVFPATISISVPLSSLTDPNDTIDGTGAGVMIDAVNMEPDPAAYNCFTIQASGVTIKGLQITDCGAGVSISSGGNNTIGPGNVLYDNAVGVLNMAPGGFSGNRVIGNMIGTTADGTAVNPDGGNTYGVWAQARTVIGGAAAGEGNVISGSVLDGVVIKASNNQVQGNMIGTGVTGTVDLGNGANGVIIDGVVGGNVIGGSTAGARNVISGNNGSGIRILSAGTNNRVQGNYIGTDAAGAADLGNSSYGVEVAAGVVIGGDAGAGEGNVISGNDQGGVHLVSSSATSNFVNGNLIGTKANGTEALGNAGPGVLIESGATNNSIGGNQAGARNVISGNAGPGVELNSSGTSQNFILGNFIGTDVSGTAALGNGGSGVKLTGANANSIGGSSAGEGNVISGNSLSGVELTGATGNLVYGNFVGAQADGVSALGNGSNGVLVTSGSSGNSIGSTPPGANVIAFNSGVGVWVQSGTGNPITGNSLHSNGGLGVDLGAVGVTPNDPGDGDTGANNLQNFPVLTSARTTGSSLIVDGSLNSTASTSFGITLYASSACDPSGNGEGRTFLGGGPYATDAAGNLSFSITLPVSVPAGQHITALAGKAGAFDTSEFSACRLVLPADTDGDGCTDSEEAALGSAFDPTAWYDVFDAPVPAVADPAPNGDRDRVVDIRDVLAVLLYAFAEDNGSPNANGVDYDADKGVDTDGDTAADIPPDGIEDGLSYDRSAGLGPDPVTGIDPAGPPDGVVDIRDVLATLAQAFVVDCSGPP